MQRLILPGGVTEMCSEPRARDHCHRGCNRACVDPNKCKMVQGSNRESANCATERTIQEPREGRKTRGTPAPPSSFVPPLLKARRLEVMGREPLSQSFSFPEPQA